MEDLEEAIQVARQAVDVTPENHPDRAALLNNLGNKLGHRYKRTGKMRDLEEAIRVALQAVEATSEEDNLDQAAYLNNLGNKLESRYQRTGKMEDLEEAIQVAQQAVDATPEDHPNRAGRLNNLGNKFESRYEYTGKIEDLEEAIQVTQQAVDITLEGHPNQAVCLSNLGNKLGRRYERTGKIKDLEEAIRVARQAVNITPGNHPDQAGRLNNLGTKLERRYEYTGNMKDLEEAIQVTRQAVDFTPEDHPDRVGRLNNLGNKFERRHQRTGEMEDLEEAIRLTRQAVDVTPKDHPNRAERLNNLGTKLESRYERTGNIEDLEEAIQVARQAIDSTPENHLNQAACLNNLGNKLGRRYERTGEIRDLEEAIQVAQQAVKVTPENHPDRAAWLSNLGIKVGHRYERTGKMEDLEEAIELDRQAVSVTPEDHPDRVVWLNNLGNKFERRHQRTRKMEDLEEAIRLTRQAVDFTAKDHPDQAACLNNLGNNLESRHQRTRKLEDLEEAIQVARQAVDVMSKDHPDRARNLNNLGNKLESRYKLTRKMGELKEAIQVARQAVDATPEDHPARAGRLNNLGSKLALSNSGISEALNLFLWAWRCYNAIPFIRISAASRAIQLFQNQGDYENAYKLSTEAINLLSHVHNRSLSRQDQQYVVSLFFGLATNACSLALQLREAPENALEILEQGRGVILSLLMDDRSDTSALSLLYPDLCKTYESLRSEANAPIDNVEDPHLRKIAVQRRTEAVEELDKCITNIRQLPEFGQFQRGLTPAQMQSCSVEGPIVVVNVTDLRSDAIIISTSSFKAISLPDLKKPNYWSTSEENDDKRDMESERASSYNPDLLSWLWLKCVKLILDKLERDGLLSIGQMSRVWWIGTGIASSFPFHAAGAYSNKDTSENALSRIIPSYTPTIKALAHSRSYGLKHSQINGEKKPSVLIATMPTTPGQNPLPGVTREMLAVQEACRGVFSCKTFERQTADMVLESIPECDIFHSACHGWSDPANPSDSHLLFQRMDVPGPVVDRLTVSRISNAVTRGRAWIAYLSACSTAQVKVPRLADEGLHIASAFQVAGFAHVIGSLWPVNDNVCVQLATLFYEKLSKSDVTKSHDGPYANRAVAEALNSAVVQVRSEHGSDPLAWAAFIHLGA